MITSRTETISMSQSLKCNKGKPTSGLDIKKEKRIQQQQQNPHNTKYFFCWIPHVFRIFPLCFIPSFFASKMSHHLLSFYSCSIKICLLYNYRWLLFLHKILSFRLLFLWYCDIFCITSAFQFIFNRCNSFVL